MTDLSRLARRLPLVLWLTVVWILLWGTLDLGTLVFGVLVAVLITALFPPPPVFTNIVVRPVSLVQLIGYLAWDLVVSTLRVSWQALRHRGDTKAGIVAVTLLTDSDHLTAMIANGISLAPGKFVLQVDREHAICYVYVLGMRPGEDASVRREVLALEARVVRAVGSAQEVALVDRHKKLRKAGS